MNKYTPGPWVYVPEAEDVIAENLPEEDMGNIICFPPQGFTDSMRRWEANAKLIAAAPELLSCVQDALSDLQEYMSDGMKNYFIKVLNKATV